MPENVFVVVVKVRSTPSMMQSAMMTHPRGCPNLHEARFQVTERALHQAACILEVREQRSPERLFCENAGITQHHHPILGACERYVQSPGVAQEANTLREKSEQASDLRACTNSRGGGI